MPFLFGLDMLRRFQCCIDLSGGNGVLRFPTLGEALPFLSEHEIPHSERFEKGEGEGEEGGKEKKEGGAGGGAAASNGAGGAAAAANGGAAAAEGGANASAAADPDKVARLSALGFEPEAAARALLSAGGNEELAASMLFGDT